MPTLEDKIKKIIEGTASDVIDEMKKDEDDEDLNSTDADNCDDEKKGKKTEPTGKGVSLEVKEENSVPHIGASQKDKPVDSNVGKSETDKIKSRYNKTTQGKLTEPKGDGTKDAKAAEETAKIKAGYNTTGETKMKEHMEALFSGESLTEEFKTKAENIFEAAVNTVAEAKVDTLAEEYQLQLEEAVDAVKGELVEQIDGYLDFVVEKWLQDNAVALESGIKVEMTSSLMSGMKKVFEEHYVDVPESKLDVVEEQAEKIVKLQRELDESKDEQERAITEASILKCDGIISIVSEGLTAIESDKLKNLAEGIEFDTHEEFQTKIESLRESYFPKNPKNKLDESQDAGATNITETDSVVEATVKYLQSKKNKLVR